MLDTLATVLGHMAAPEYWIAFLVGLSIATVLGFIPGLGATVMMAIAFPIVLLTIQEPAIGIVMLAVITGTGNTFDSLPAQLMGVTTGGTQVSFLEGHQLARRGLGAYSLGAVYAVSAIGGIVGAVALFMTMQVAKPLITALSFSEIAVLALFGLSMVAVLSKGAMLKGLASAAFGVLLGTVGLQTFTNTERFTFGDYHLREGLPFVAVIAGVMAIPEMLDLAASRKPVAPPGTVVTNREVFRGFREGLRRWRLAIRHSVLGVVLGALPGTGGSFVTWMSYGIGIARSKDKKQFGKGSLDGLLFAESAENAKEGGQAIPTLALGIPGSSSWALVAAALLAYGISPGPRLVQNHSDIIWLIVFSFALANLIVTLLALLVTRQIMRITAVPYPAIVATVLPIVVLGAYFADPIMEVIPVIALMGAIGLAMKHFRWPRPPLVLGFVLAEPIEENLFTAVNLFGPWGIVTRPVTIIMAVISILVVWRLLRSMHRTDEFVETNIHPTAPAEGTTPARVSDGDQPADTVVPARTAVAVGAGSAEAHEAGAPAALDQAEQRPLTTQDSGSVQVKSRGRIALRWRSEHWVALAFTVGGLYVLYTSLSYDRLAAKLLPSLMAGAIALTAGAHLLTLIFSRRTKHEDVLDIAMRSVGMEGARKAALQLGGLLAMYGLLTYAVGIQYSGLAFAIATPLVLMKGRVRFLTAAISAALFWLFVTGIGDYLLNIRWPHGWLI